MANIRDVAVISKTGKPLMPTSRYRARKLIKKGKAVIYRYRPVLTIRLTEREDGEVQGLELKVDTGYQHIGISVCSEMHEHMHRQYDLLSDETEKYNDRRKYRRTRRNRKRYREPRYDNRKGLVSRDGFAPSIRNRRDRHADLVREICAVMPVTNSYIEMGQFDTQVLKAVELGLPVPEGGDYQHGEQYGFMTLREAVFTRDGHACIVCKRSVKDGAILHEHHIGFWKGDRTNRPSNLATVCEKCHTPSNHKPGGKLYGMKPVMKPLKEATFMTSVRYGMLKEMKASSPHVAFHMTYGAATKLSRRELGIPKTHANDAYAMGRYHPKHRARQETFQKHRRNNRVLERFYDARYIDIRDGSRKKGSELGCNRTNRREPRMSPKNERIFRGRKVSAGHRSIRHGRTRITPGSRVKYGVEIMHVKGIHNSGSGVNVEFTKPASNGRKSASLKKLKVLGINLFSGWEQANTL